MMTTPASLLPPDEAERLNTLRHYEIVTSLHEPVFDEFVALAARIFSLPISLIALVEEDEVHYKASLGLPGLVSQPRVEALCSNAVRQNKAVIFADLSEEEQRITSAANAAARSKGLRFYAGAPLQMPDHRAIGTLCVIDRQPRSFSADEQSVLSQLAGLVAQTIAVRHHCLSSGGTGASRWDVVQEMVLEELQALVALVRYLVTRAGVEIPVSAAVLGPIARRLNDLQVVLLEYLATSPK